MHFLNLKSEPMGIMPRCRVQSTAGRWGSNAPSFPYNMLLRKSFNMAILQRSCGAESDT